ncbi:hypothetical protein, partial [Streptomyces sp. NPDC002159]
DELEELYLRDAIYFHHPRYLAHLNCPVVSFSDYIKDIEPTNLDIQIIATQNTNHTFELLEGKYYEDKGHDLMLEKDGSFFYFKKVSEGEPITAGSRKYTLPDGNHRFIDTKRLKDNYFKS